MSRNKIPSFLKIVSCYRMRYDNNYYRLEIIGEVDKKKIKKGKLNEYEVKNKIKTYFYFNYFSLTSAEIYDKYIVLHLITNQNICNEFRKEHAIEFQGIT